MQYYFYCVHCGWSYLRVGLPSNTNSVLRPYNTMAFHQRDCTRCKSKKAGFMSTLAGNVMGIDSHTYFDGEVTEKVRLEIQKCVKDMWD